MINTKLPTTPANLLKLVKNHATSETLEMIQTELENCKTDVERAEWAMECYFSFDQDQIIVKIAASETWGLIANTEDEQGDCAEYLDLINDNVIKEWHE